MTTLQQAMLVNKVRLPTDGLMLPSIFKNTHGGNPYHVNQSRLKAERQDGNLRNHSESLSSRNFKRRSSDRRTATDQIFNPQAYGQRLQV